MKNLLVLTFSLIIIFANDIRVPAFDATPSNELNTEGMLPQDVAIILENNVKQLDPISFAWVTTRTTNMDKKTFFTKMKMEESFGFLEPVVNSFMWQKGSAYSFRAANTVINLDIGGKKKFFAYDDNLPLSLYGCHYAIDGKNYYSAGTYQTEKTPGSISIHPLTSEVVAIVQPITFCYGYRFPLFGKEFSTPPSSYVNYLAEKFGVVQTKNSFVDNLDIFEIELKSQGYNVFDNNQVDRRITFMLLPSYNYAVKQIDIKSIDNRLAHRVINDQFQIIPNTSVYIPHKTVIEHYNYVTIDNNNRSSPLFYETMHLTDVSTKKIDPRIFDLREKMFVAGTMVCDTTFHDTGNGIIYDFPANPADLDRVIEAALTGKGYVPTPLPSSFAMFVRWVLIISGCCLIAYTLFAKFIKKTN